MISGAPSAGVNSTLRPASSRPLPLNAVTPLALNSPAMPPVSWPTIWRLRFCIASRSSVSSPVWMPCTARPCPASWNLCELSSSAFEGMQPTLRQVPPNTGLPSPLRHFSITAVFSPSCAQRIAAT